MAAAPDPAYGKVPLVGPVSVAPPGNVPDSGVNALSGLHVLYRHINARYHPAQTSAISDASEWRQAESAG